ncbi:hypothetical protein RRG08_064369 [Elysia crispata]|uniref:Uncharacterized protein n=1 Tax=Elysia crispata TaxID=231223 RepID=A0AAE1D250_9GAST|nr:hypothetical protein RRG08_064369 [Elysia crispata]
MNQANRKTDGSTGWGGVCPGTFFLFLVEGKKQGRVFYPSVTSVEEDLVFTQK